MSRRRSRRRRQTNLRLHSNRDSRPRSRGVTVRDTVFTVADNWDLFPIRAGRPQPKARRRQVVDTPNVNLGRIDQNSFAKHKARLDRLHGVNTPEKPFKRVLRSVCDQRRERREVLFAKGKGGAGNARPVFTQQSKVRCK